MARIPPKFNFGTELQNDNPILYNQLNSLYSLIASVINTKTSKFTTTQDPVATSASNSLFDIGDIWINTSSDSAWMMTSRSTNNTVTWTLIT